MGYTIRNPVLHNLPLLSHTQIVHRNVTLFNSQRLGFLPASLYDIRDEDDDDDEEEEEGM